MTKKAILVAAVGLLIATMAVPSNAQGAFADVPIDHWAYEAVSQLQDHGIIIGYPDGTFSGKRALTRYEFAVALSRAIPVILDMVETEGPGISRAQVQQMIDNAVGNIPTTNGGPTGNFASQSDVDALRRTTNEFRDELVQLGVDVDALKRDLASLEERVAVIEEEMRRLRITTKLNFFAVGESTDEGFAVDRDNRPLSGDNNLLQSLQVVRDADVIFNYENGDTTAKVVVNAGNYFNYLGGLLTNFTGTPRAGSDNADAVNLFLAYGSVPIWGADVTVGRFPIQFTKYTLKKFDVDTYSENWKTDDGNYYVDGGKAEWTWGSVDILAFAGKNNGNAGAYNLTSRPGASGLYAFSPLVATGAGQLQMPVQSAGVRAGFDLGSARIGLNWISVGEGSPAGGPYYDQADIWGADVELPVGSWNLAGSYTETNSSGTGGVADLEDDNFAWEAALRGNWGGFGINAGYKHIEPNFSAPGDWARLGMWQNPVNIKGPEVGVTFGIGDRISLMAYGGFFQGVSDTMTSNIGTPIALAGWEDSDLDHYKAALNLDLGTRSSLGIQGEWVKYQPSAVLVAGAPEPNEAYYTITYNRMLTDSSKLRLLYQIIDFDSDGGFLGGDYEGAVAVAQVSMDF